MSDSSIAARIESDIPPIRASAPSSRTFTLTVRELLRSIPDPTFISLIEVDGLSIQPPLLVETISRCTEFADPQDPDVDITVWSPKGWMFSFRLCPQAQGGREVTITFQED